MLCAMLQIGLKSNSGAAGLSCADSKYPTFHVCKFCTHGNAVCNIVPFNGMAVPLPG